MPEVASQIRAFNLAFQVAWDHAIDNDRIAPGVAQKLSVEISRQIKAGARDPEVIGRAAYEAVFKG